MSYAGCSSLSASSYHGPTLLDVCTATTFLAFISNLQSQIEDSDAISGASECLTLTEEPDDEYDFIVVGGGVGGCVVASRLSENPEWTVLLLEAGLEPPVATQLPGFSNKFLVTPETIWNYTTTNEPYACRARNGSCAWPTGRVLGGNSIHNSMIFIRGVAKDFNNWAAAGNDGWTWPEVLEYYKKMEDNGEIDRVGTEYHGTGGPLSIERLPYVVPFSYDLLDAAKEVGFGVSDDLNGDYRTGFSLVQSTSKDGMRESALSAYLQPAIDRENLDISIESHVTKILIEDGTAVGVEYFKNGEYKIVYAKKEVIVSGGALNSPQILMLSGIGPKDHLESVGIEVVSDLPGVGENLQDHAATNVKYTMDVPDVYLNNRDVAAEYLNDQTGPLSAYGTVSLVGVLATDLTEADYPDLQVYVSAYVASCAPGEVGALASNGKRVLTVLPSHDHPKSRGRVTLASNDPFEYPIFVANYLDNEYDLEAHLIGIKLVNEWTKAEALKEYNLTMIPVEACSAYELESDDYYTCTAYQDNYAMYHFAGTCKMGPASDPMAVVDSRLKVHGIDGLRVADASIMPVVTSCNTQAPTYMIGERAADFIKEDW